MTRSLLTDNLVISLGSLRRRAYLTFAAFVAILGVGDWLIISTFANKTIVGTTLSSSVTQAMLTDLIQIDGVLLGFVGAVFGVILTRNRIRFAWFLFGECLAFLATLSFFFYVITEAFLDMASQIPVTSLSFGTLLAYSANGLVTLFFSIVMLDLIKSVLELSYPTPPAASKVDRLEQRLYGDVGE